MTTDKRDLIATAQNLARNLGWSVFPCAEDKSPALAKSEGGRGFHDASTDPDVIHRLFNHRNACLIGVATGAVSGFDVLDVDIKHAAARAWLIAAKDKIPATRTYQTRSGGFHVLFKHADGVINSESIIARGLDTRGDGGYIVFWFAAGHPCTDSSPITEWPAWLLEALFYKPPPPPTPPQQKFRSNGGDVHRLIEATIGQLERAAEGSRHATLRAAACTIGGVLGTASMPPATASRLLLDAVIRAGGAKVDHRNALATIAWGLERGAASPLQLGRTR